MSRSRLSSLMIALARAFQQRSMWSHLRTLRLYWLAVRHGLTSGEGHHVRVDWSEQSVLEWLRLLRVPPYEHAYAVRPRGSSCRSCPRRAGHPVEVRTEVVFPGGAKMSCRGCSDVWIELDNG